MGDVDLTWLPAVICLLVHVDTVRGGPTFQGSLHGIRTTNLRPCSPDKLHHLFLFGFRWLGNLVLNLPEKFLDFPSLIPGVEQFLQFSTAVLQT